ncbi:MAG: DMT family transporter [candidate division Zixibacteria bacterium]|nr:DMT family transporter [Candidatus Tariuqbacter arcticus]
MRKHIAADLALLFLTALWGLSFPLVKTALMESGTFTFITIRFVISAIILYPFIKRGERLLPRPILGWGIILGLSVFAGFALQTWGLTLTTASRSGFITGMLVVMVPFLAVPILHSQLKFRHLIAAFAALAGIFMLTRPDLDRINTGDVLTLGCAFAFALQTVVLQKIGKRELSLRLAFYQIVFIAALSLPVGIIAEGFRGVGSAKVWGLAALTASLSTALAFWIQARFQPMTKAQSAAVIYSMEPVFAAIFANILLGELMPNALGAGLIIMGMIAAEWRRDNRQ